MNPLNNIARNNLSAGIWQAKNMLNQLRTISNPIAMIQNDPQVANVMKMLQGRNPEDVFYQMCKEQNINPNDILGQLR